MLHRRELLFSADPVHKGALMNTYTKIYRKLEQYLYS
jgi:hypothetical protein